MDPQSAGYDGDQARLFYRTALDRLRALPGVRQAALSSCLPFSINFNVE
jgi:hypothetical protein